MKKILLTSFLSCLFKLCLAQNVTTDSTYIKYVHSINISTNNFSTILPLITQPGNNEEEKLKLVYYWVYDHITFDIDRFLQKGSLQPLDISETLKSGKGMCYEYNEFIDAACKYLNISGYKIEGYVKYYGFEPDKPFTDNNHIWYVVNIKGNWKMIDMLWCCGTLATKAGSYTFKKKLHNEYFLVDPNTFLSTHLPADPIWQFTDKPLSMSGFISKTDGIDSTKRYNFINYADTINSMNRLNVRDRELKSGIRAYNFNPDNPNQLIVLYYNDAVDLINNVKATKSDLLKARKYFSESELLIPKSKDENIKSLSPICQQGITSIESRLKYIKS